MLTYVFHHTTRLRLSVTQSVCLRLPPNISAYNCRICSCAAVCLGVWVCVSVRVCLGWGCARPGASSYPCWWQQCDPSPLPRPLPSPGAIAAPASSSPSWGHLAAAPWRPSSQCATSCSRHRKTSVHPPPLPSPAPWDAARPLLTAWRR